jgi:hypothetical protein
LAPSIRTNIRLGWKSSPGANTLADFQKYLGDFFPIFCHPVCDFKFGESTSRAFLFIEQEVLIKNLFSLLRLSKCSNQTKKLSAE